MTNWSLVFMILLAIVLFLINLIKNEEVGKSHITLIIFNILPLLF
jgi:hypothetical protein